MKSNEVAPRVLVSAHRTGAEGSLEKENRLSTIRDALRWGVDYVEFDIHATRDGKFVLFHDDHFADESGNLRYLRDLDAAYLVEHLGMARLEDVAKEIAGRSRAHVDFKFLPGVMRSEGGETLCDEIRAMKVLLEHLQPSDVIITTLEDESVRLVRQWTKSYYPEMLVGLSLGRSVAGAGRLEAIRTRLSEIFPRPRLVACDANLVVANKTLAKISLRKLARRLNLPLLVWTVDDPDELAYWLSPGRAWMVTSNFPRLALRIRDADE